MKKKITYTILVIVTTIIIFITTACTTALETTAIGTTETETTTTGATTDNNPPEIKQIVLPSENMEVHRSYDIKVEVTDADGDSLLYSWAVSDGIIDDSSLNPMTWTTPPFDGNYKITVKVDDGNGGTDTKIESVNIYPQPFPVISVDLPIDHKGYIAQGLICNGVNCFIGVGDSVSNKPIRCYLSFNIEDLFGVTVINVILFLGDYIFVNDPSFVDGVFIDVVDWGDNELLEPSDYNLVGSLLAEQDLVADGGAINISTNKLKDMLQEAINNDRSDFQIRIIPGGITTNNNNQHDRVQFNDNNIYLSVDFTGP